MSYRPPAMNSLITPCLTGEALGKARAWEGAKRLCNIDSLQFIGGAALEPIPCLCYQGVYTLASILLS